MPFDFPNSPTDGQQFTPAGGPTYVWNAANTVWKLVGGIGAPGNLSLGDNPPGSPAQGQMWLETDTGNLFAWWDDGNSAAWVQINVPNAVNSVSNIVRTVITTLGAGTYTKPNGLKFLEVECMSGGGAGGGAAITAAGQYGVGGGGGGGSWGRQLFAAASLGATVSYSVGAGGTGVTGATGNAGGITSFGTLSVSGGTGGLTSAAAAVVSATPGGSGTVTGGDFSSSRGASGTAGLGVFAATMWWSGDGAHTAFGNGGRGAYLGSANGVTGAGYGGGGGGAVNGASSAATRPGGDGLQGFIRLTEYY